MLMFGQDAYETQYECSVLDAISQRVVVAPEKFTNIDDVGVFIKRRYDKETTDFLIQSIERFSDGRSERFTHTKNGWTLVVMYHYI